MRYRVVHNTSLCVTTLSLVWRFCIYKFDNV